MKQTVAFLFLLSLFLPGCSISKLGSEIDHTDKTYGYLKVAPVDATTTNGRVRLVVFQQIEAGPKLINYNTPKANADSFFLVPIADYSIGAFEDLNHDFIYQSGEPAAFSNSPPLYTGAAKGKEALKYDSIESLALQLSPGNKLPWAVDLSEHSPQKQISQVRENFLKVTSWSNPAFSENTVRKGLWQPLSFHEQTGYGLYLLEELDSKKQPLLLVHGINGSPLNFKALTSGLGENFQLLLFQYPSGFPLEHTAYILHKAVNEFLERHAYKKLHVLAHSMGGLVSRGMLTLNDSETNARIDTYITLSTPWSGHAAARMGVEWSPAIAPVWRSMAPNSEYLQRIFSIPLAATIKHYLFFSYAHERDGASKGDDGVVSVQSQLNYQAQEQSQAIYGIDDNHTGILSNPCVIATVQLLLESGNEGQGDRTLASCP